MTLPEKHYDKDLIEIETLYRFRVELLRSVLMTASLIGFVVGVLQSTDILPGHAIYTPSVLLYALVNIGALILLKNPDRYFLTAIHICLLSAFAILALLSALVTYDELRFSWFYLLIFAAYALAGAWYGVFISLLTLVVIYVQYFILELHISPYGLFTFTATLFSLNAAILFFLRVIRQDTSLLQHKITTEITTRRSKESLLEQMEKEHTLNLKQGYFWDTRYKKLIYDDKEIPLTQKEQKLLNLFVHKKNSCVSFEDIMIHLWEDAYENDISVSTVKVYVSNLRKKLPPEYIKNVYGQGYILHI